MLNMTIYFLELEQTTGHLYETEERYDLACFSVSAGHVTLQQVIVFHL